MSFTESEISEGAVDAAISVVKYAINSTMWLLKNRLTESDFDNQCRRVTEFIAKHEGKVTRQKLLSSHCIKTGGLKSYDAVTEFLIDSGVLGLNNAAKRTDNLYFLLEPGE